MENAMPNIQLTERDEMYLSWLTRCVKVIALFQLSSVLWANGKKCVRRIRLLEKCGLVKCVRLFGTGPFCPMHCLAQWRPGQPAPHFKRVLRAASRYWDGRIECVNAVTITSEGAARFGGYAKPPCPSEGSHDLRVAEVFLTYETERPSEARYWVGEQLLTPQVVGTTDYVPDALVRRPGLPVAIEVIGESYGVSKLEKIHAHCADRGWGYELW